jgi:hypothetical protein
VLLLVQSLQNGTDESARPTFLAGLLHTMLSSHSFCLSSRRPGLSFLEQHHLAYIVVARPTQWIKRETLTILREYGG